MAQTYAVPIKTIKEVNTVKDWCAITGSAPNRFYQEMNSGRLVVRKYGRRSIVLREDFLAWLRALPVATSCGE